MVFAKPRKVVLIDVSPDIVYPNPWQPRKALDPVKTAELAESIRRMGLLQRPIVRPKTIPDDIKPICNCPGSGGETPRPGCPEHYPGFEISFGHYRVEAMKLLIAERRVLNSNLDLQRGIPVEVRDLSDEDMALIALTENQQRKDITPLEAAKAYKKALDEIHDLTLDKLADSLNIARSTLSNALRILTLPDVVLDKVESEDLSLHAAREFLVLQASDHIHLDEMTQVIERIAGYKGNTGLPDFRVANVRKVLRSIVIGVHEREWRPLDSKENDTGNYGEGAWREPTFDTGAFQKEFPTLIHSIPRLAGDRSRVWTCSVKDWQRWQTAATRSQNLEDKDKHKGKVQPVKIGSANTRSAQFLRAIAEDPAVKKVTGKGVSWETASAQAIEALEKDAKTIAEEPLAELRTQTIEYLKAHPSKKDWVYNRAVDKLVEESTDGSPRDYSVVSRLIADARSLADQTIASGAAKKLTDEHREKLGTRAEDPAVFDYSNKSFHQKISQLPVFFDNPRECTHECVKGARYGQEYRGNPVELYCTNKACYDKKFKKGKEDFKVKLAKDQDQWNKEETRLAEAFAHLLVSSQLSWTVCVVLLSLIKHPSARTVEGVGCLDSKEFTYEPLPALKVQQLLNLKRSKDTWDSYIFDSEMALKVLPKPQGGPSSDRETLQMVASWLMVYVLRYELRNGVSEAMKLLGLTKDSRELQEATAE